MGLESTEEATTSPVLLAANCTGCQEGIAETDRYCQKCGFPLKGSEQEQNDFIYNRSYKHLELQDLDKKIKSAATTLFVLAGLFLLFGLIYFTGSSKSDSAPSLLISDGVLIILFLLMGFWAGKKPVAAIISGLVLFIVLQILAVIDNPANLMRGVLIKILIIGYLIKGLNSAFKAEKIKKQLNIV